MAIFLSATDMHTHKGIWPHRRMVALNAWQLSLCTNRFHCFWAYNECENQLRTTIKGRMLYRSVEGSLGSLGIPFVHDDSSISLTLELLEDGLHLRFEVFKPSVNGVLKNN